MVNLPVASKAVGADERALGSLVADKALVTEVLNALHLGGAVAVVVGVTTEVRALGRGHGQGGESDEADGVGVHFGEESFFFWALFFVLWKFGCCGSGATMD